MWQIVPNHIHFTLVESYFPGFVSLNIFKYCVKLRKQNEMSRIVLVATNPLKSLE